MPSDPSPPRVSRTFSGLTASRPAGESTKFVSPMKAATNSVAGRVVDLLRRRQLLDPATVHDRDAVGHRERLLLVVRHVDEGDPDRLLDPLELDLEGLADLQVEGPERLVEQEHLRAHHERAGERDPLLLTARELPRPSRSDVAEMHELEHLLRPHTPIPARDPPLLESVRDVVEHGEVREERVRLEDGVDGTPVGRQVRDVAAVDQHDAGVRPLEAGDQAKGRRLAAAGRPEQRHELPFDDGQVECFDGGDVAEAPGNGSELDVVERGHQ